MPDARVEWKARTQDLRDPAAVIAHWDEASETNPALLRHRASRDWWDLLQGMGVCLLVTREYEHLVMSLCPGPSRPRISYMRLPHPSGLVVDRTSNEVIVAATRNPNQVLTLRPAVTDDGATPVLVPVRSDFYPGASYLHDLAIVDGKLVANSTSQNAVVRLENNTAKRVWWPRCLDALGNDAFKVNHLQLNSIAAGADLASSFFTASVPEPVRRRPGHLDFPVDRRGVVFSGRSRDVVATGLTRPHSARLHEGRLWVDNSGYGELGVVEGERFEPLVRLPGWTRGLALVGTVAFVGTSRVIPEYRRYAPGVDSESCGVYAIDIRTGSIQAWLKWPAGNQIFAIDWIPSGVTSGLPFTPVARSTRVRNASNLFYRYRLVGSNAD